MCLTVVSCAVVMVEAGAGRKSVAHLALDPYRFLTHIPVIPIVATVSWPDSEKIGAGHKPVIPNIFPVD